MCSLASHRNVHPNLDSLCRVQAGTEAASALIFRGNELGPVSEAMAIIPSSIPSFESSKNLMLDIVTPPMCCISVDVFLWLTGWWLGHPSEKYESQLG